MLVETWHSASTDTALRRCVPRGYSLHEVARPSDGSAHNHGGVQRPRGRPPSIFPWCPGFGQRPPGQ